VVRAEIRVCGGIAPLVALLASRDTVVQSRAAGALFNCALDGTRRSPAVPGHVLTGADGNKAEIRSMDAFKSLIALLSSPSDECQANAAGALMNCCTTGTARCVPSGPVR
jgi:hypothetical protein